LNKKKCVRPGPTITLDSSRDKNIEDKSIKEKSIRNTNVDKKMQIDNVFSTNILIFCNRKDENKSLKLLYFKKLKDIKSWSTFLFLNAYFNI